MPLLVHGESTDPAVDVFDREAAFIDTTLQPMLKDFPALKVVLEHITTEVAAHFVASHNRDRLAATITPQHLMFNRNAMFTGGLRPHHYCLPVLKRERHRVALRALAVSGHPRVFLGTDSAPHPRKLKETGCGCAGIFNAPTALQSYATVFEEENALDKLEGFASVHGARFYGLPLNEDTVTLVKQPCAVLPDIELPEGGSIHPFLGGCELPWSIAKSPRGR
jgi:dihydroorotase